MERLDEEGLLAATRLPVGERMTECPPAPPLTPPDSVVLSLLPKLPPAPPPPPPPPRSLPIWWLEGACCIWPCCCTEEVEEPPCIRLRFRRSLDGLMYWLMDSNSAVLLVLRMECELEIYWVP